MIQENPNYGASKALENIQLAIARPGPVIHNAEMLKLAIERAIHASFLSQGETGAGERRGLRQALYLIDQHIEGNHVQESN